MAIAHRGPVHHILPLKGARCLDGVKVCEFDGATSTNEGYNKVNEQIRRDLGREGSIAVVDGDPVSFSLLA